MENMHTNDKVWRVSAFICMYLCVHTHLFVHTFTFLCISKQQLFQKAFNSWTYKISFLGNFPSCLPYNLYDVSLENLELDQPIVPWFIFFFIIISCLLDTVLMV